MIGGIRPPCTAPGNVRPRNNVTPLPDGGTVKSRRSRPQERNDTDAVSVGVAALTGHGLTTTRMDATVTALRAIVEHRDDLVKTPR
ncbi:hypothetical protein [Rhodococcus jostii]|uniref:hypothetical protein n=1 Tax=Rhodococcus jostii TaxID=132919 RepID=UPI00363574FC